MARCLPEDARSMALELDRLNEERKSIEKAVRAKMPWPRLSFFRKSVDWFWSVARITRALSGSPPAGSRRHCSSHTIRALGNEHGNLKDPAGPCLALTSVMP